MGIPKEYALRDDSHISDEIFIRWLTFFTAQLFFFWILWHNGLIQSVVRTDPTRLSVVIIFIFLCGTLHCAARSAYLSARLREITRIMRQPEYLQLPAADSRVVWFDGRPLPSSPVTDYLADAGRCQSLSGGEKRPGQLNDLGAVLGDEITGSHETGWFFAQLLVKLGLLGTVVGFIIMLASTSGTISYEAAHVPELFSGMTGGMRIALNTTLVGLLGTILLSFQYLMIDRSADRLLRAVTRFIAVEWPGSGVGSEREDA